MKIFNSLLLVIISNLFFISLSFAHHSISTSYNPRKLQTIEGVVHKFNLRSPHSSIELDVINEEGVTERWVAESHAVPMLRRHGLTKDSIKPGDWIKISGPPSITGTKKFIFGARVYLANGATYTFMKSPLLSAEEPKLVAKEEIQAIEDSAAKSLEGTVLERFAGRWDSFSGAIGKNKKLGDPSPLPLNKAGLAARDAYDPTDTPAMRCHPIELPGLDHAPFLMDIHVDGQNVLFHHEYQDAMRSVDLSTGKPEVGEPRMYGYSAARLEGETLIIEHAGFAAHPVGLGSDWDANGRGQDIPSSEEKRFTERFSIRDGGKELVLNYVLEDPFYMSKPYELEIVWKRASKENTEIYEFNCDVEAATKSSLYHAPGE
jgi:hypothetical protein